jgi:RNA polymerase sigma factor (sigma-70 family)
MTPRSFAPALRHVRQLLAQADAAGSTDAQLLQSFVNGGDEAAFELLVWRHGPMALGVCRRMLPNAQDAEDAFQATLLALARKANSIGKGGSVGSWLYKVAYRVALRARAEAQRRARHEKHLPVMPAVADPYAADPAWRELRPVLDEELSRLPDKYRAPMVLCYLDGLTNEEAAGRLQCPAGTVKTRLAHARELLRSRLTQRGLFLGAGLFAADSLTIAAQVPAGLVAVTVRAAMLVAAGKGVAAGVVPAHVVNLTEGVLRAMTMMKLRLLAAVLAAGLSATGVGVVSYQALAGAALAGEPAKAQGPSAAQRAEQIKKQIAGLQQELRQAELDAAREKASGKVPPLVAVIFGDIPITREEWADHLIARLTADQLEMFVNRRIIEHACSQKGITVTDAEIEANVREDMKALGGGSLKVFQATLHRFNKTPFEWKEDVIRPRLLMTKLCRERITVTEKELRNAFEAKFGEQVECQLILWPKGQKEQAARDYEAIRADANRFEWAAGIQAEPTLASSKGRMKPFGRHSSEGAALEKTAFALRAGEISPLIDTPEGTALIKCLRRIPADTATEFEDVRADLRQEVLDRLVQREVPKAFQELKEQARPRLLWHPSGS